MYLSFACLPVVVLIKHFKAAHWAGLISIEPFLDAIFHEEVLEVARQDDNVVLHVRVFLA